MRTGVQRRVSDPGAPWRKPAAGWAQPAGGRCLWLSASRRGGAEGAADQRLVRAMHPPGTRGAGSGRASSRLLGPPPRPVPSPRPCTAPPRSGPHRPGLAPSPAGLHARAPRSSRYRPHLAAGDAGRFRAAPAGSRPGSCVCVWGEGLGTGR